MLAATTGSHVTGLCCCIWDLLGYSSRERWYWFYHQTSLPPWGVMQQKLSKLPPISIPFQGIVMWFSKPVGGPGDKEGTDLSEGILDGATERFSKAWG